MMGKKKLSDVRRELKALLEKLPDDTPGRWIDREIQAAEGESGRDVETLQMLRSALQQSARKKPNVSTKS